MAGAVAKTNPFCGLITATYMSLVDDEVVRRTRSVLEKELNRLAPYLPMEALAVGGVYMVRLHETGLRAGSTSEVLPLAVASLYLAVKFLYDEVAPGNFRAFTVALPSTELLCAESRVLKMLNWRLFVSGPEHDVIRARFAVERPVIVPSLPAFAAPLSPNFVFGLPVSTTAPSCSSQPLLTTTQMAVSASGERKFYSSPSVQPDFALRPTPPPPCHPCSQSHFVNFTPPSTYTGLCSQYGGAAPYVPPITDYGVGVVLDTPPPPSRNDTCMQYQHHHRGPLQHPYPVPNQNQHYNVHQRCSLPPMARNQNQDFYFQQCQYQHQPNHLLYQQQQNAMIRKTPVKHVMSAITKLSLSHATANELLMEECPPVRGDENDRKTAATGEACPPPLHLSEVTMSTTARLSPPQEEHAAVGRVTTSACSNGKSDGNCMLTTSHVPKYEGTPSTVCQKSPLAFPMRPAVVDCMPRSSAVDFNTWPSAVFTHNH